MINEKSFECADGRERCDLKCMINRLRIGGTVHPFGGVCSRHYNFMPFMKEMPVPGGNNSFDCCNTCGFSMAGGAYVRHAFRDRRDSVRILTLCMSFREGWERGEEPFVGVGAELGFSRTASRDAFVSALALFRSWDRECKGIGRTLLAELERDPEKTAIVLFGRPCNAYAPEANKGIPKKFSSRGDFIVPFDMVPWEEEPVREEFRDKIYWEAGPS